jgi:hypothetical protein
MGPQIHTTDVRLSVLTFALIGLLFSIPSLGAQAAQTPSPKPSTQKSTAPTQKAEPKVEAAKPPSEGLSVEEVIQLVQAGLSEDLVVTKIKKNGKAFDLTTGQLVQLKKAGVSDTIIKLMLDPRAAQESGDRPAAKSAVPVNPTSEPANPPSSPRAEPGSTGTLFPDEQGVYWANGGRELVRMEGMGVSNVRTGSTLVSGVTGGIKRARINAQLRGARSEFRMKERQPQFYFYLPENSSIGDYILLKVAQRLDVRQIEIGQQTFWKKQVGVDQAMEVPFTQKRVKSRIYLVTPNHELEPGEYAFYTAAGISAIELKKESGRVYDFGIDP